MDAETPVILGRDGQPTLLTLLIGAETTGILGRGCRLKLQSQAMEAESQT